MGALCWGLLEAEYLSGWWQPLAKALGQRWNPPKWTQEKSQGKSPLEEETLSWKTVEGEAWLLRKVMSSAWEWGEKSRAGFKQLSTNENNE